MRSQVGWRGERTLFIRVRKPLPSRCILKTLRGSPKGKTKREQYLLAVGLGGYSISHFLLDLILSLYRDNLVLSLVTK